MSDVSPPVDLGFEFNVSIGKLSAEVRKQRHLQAALMAPVFFKRAATGVFPASGPLILGLGKPQQGFFWYVRSIRVGGLSPTTTAAGRADIYTSSGNIGSIGNPMTMAQLGMVDWVDQATTLPLQGSYSRGELPLNQDEHLFVVFSNGTATQSYVATASIEQFEWGPIRQDWGV